MSHAVIANGRPSVIARPPLLSFRGRFSGREILFSLTLLLALALTGCVKRAITVESDPPGASVWINEHPMGIAPVTYEFITHGRYRIRLQKNGFRELIAREFIRAPIHQWIPLDLFFEYIWPFQLNDVHRFRYQLSPLPPEEKLMVEEPADLEKAVAQLNDPNPAVRRLAIIVLARHRDAATLEAVRTATQDPDPKVRAVALGALRGIEGVKSLPQLLDFLRADPEPQVRWQAAAELEALHSEEAVPGLMEALRDKDSLVRSGAAEALKGIPDRRAVGPLSRTLRDKDTAARRAAAEALGLIGDRSAVRPLTRSLFHHDFITRRESAGSLRRLRDPASGPALVRTFTDWDRRVRQIATEALIDFGDERVVPLLIRRLRALKPWTREHAAQVLGGLKDPRAVEPLARAFRREPDPPAGQAMYNALLALGSKPDETWNRTLQWRIDRAEEKRKKQEEKEKK